MCDKNDIEDEYHFIINVCYIYNKKKSHYIPTYHKKARMCKFFDLKVTTKLVLSNRLASVKRQLIAYKILKS